MVAIGSIVLLGSLVALLEWALLGRNWLWVLPVLALTAQYTGVQFAPGPCGNSEGFLTLVLFFVLGGYVCVCGMRAGRNVLRSAA